MPVLQIEENRQNHGERHRSDLAQGQRRWQVKRINSKLATSSQVSSPDFASTSGRMCAVATKRNVPPEEHDDENDDGQGRDIIGVG